MRRICSCALSLLLLGGLALAHDSEPINTDFAAPFARGAGNVQVLTQYLRNAPLYDQFEIDFEYGFARRMQFTVNLPFTHKYDGETQVRPGNMEFEYRYLIAGANDRKFAVSLNPSLGVPSGDKRVAERAYDVGGAVHLDTHLVGRLWTHTNIGYETPVAHFDEKEKTFFYRNAAMYQLSHRWQPVLELVGFHDYNLHQGQLAVVPETIFAPNHHWELKVGVPLGVSGQAPDVGAQFEVTWKFGEGRE